MAIVRARKVSTAPLLSVIIPLALSLAWQPLVHDVKFPQIYASLAISLIAFVATLLLIPWLGPTFVKAGLKGRDLLKKSMDDVPECMGLVAALVYICALVCFIPVPFRAAFVRDPLTSQVNPEYAPHRQLAVYLAALLSLLIAAILGLLDDLFDIRWRHKLPIPLIASVPLLLVYYAEQGNTHVVPPKPLQQLLGTYIDLGPLYYAYMALLSTFTTNSINILAGINGVEVAQTIVISFSVILNDLLFLPWPFTLRLGHFETSGFLGAALAQERHLFSLYFMMPLLAVSLGFAYHNKYPARAFPGDTLCYFSGMAFAVALSWIEQRYFVPTLAKVQTLPNTAPDPLPSLDPLLKQYKAKLKLVLKDSSLRKSMALQITSAMRAFDGWISEAATTAWNTWDYDEEERISWALEKLCTGLTQGGGLVPIAKRKQPNSIQEVDTSLWQPLIQHLSSSYPDFIPVFADSLVMAILDPLDVTPSTQEDGQKGIGYYTCLSGWLLWVVAQWSDTPSCEPESIITQFFRDIPKDGALPDHVIAVVDELGRQYPRVQPMVESLSSILTTAENASAQWTTDSLWTMEARLETLEIKVPVSTIVAATSPSLSGWRLLGENTNWNPCPIGS
ncbi:tunicamycin resistance protein [Serendipita sp. 399]|nr:tunicamycin resistance protein [Serendipita sp. 399]